MFCPGTPPSEAIKLQSDRYRIVADENIQVTPELLSISESLLTLPGRVISAEHLVNADVLLVRSVTPVTEQLLATSKVAFVGTATAGVEHIDTQYLAARGIGFASAPGANANAVTEYVLSVLAARGRIAKVLDGGTVGIVGYGHVGQRLARVILDLGGQVKVWDPWQSVPHRVNCTSLEVVLTQEVVTLHAALHGQEPWPSLAMINTSLPLGKPSKQLFINAARGELVTKDAMRTLEKSGADIVLDVWPNEPSISAGELARVSLGTAHIAGYSLSAKAVATNMLVTALTGVATKSEQQVSPPIDMTGRGSESAGAWLSRLLLASYDPANDAEALAKICVDNVESHDFDALRRNYSLRRELRGRPVLMPLHCDGGLDSLVAAVGGVPVHP